MTNHATENCPICELGMSSALTVVSRHRTSTGAVVYARCQCGRLSMWTEAAAAVAATPELSILAADRAGCRVPS